MAHAAAKVSHHSGGSQNDEDYGEHYYEWDKERGEAKRPFRLWNANEKKNIQWRYYADKKRAHIGALIEARWSPIGTTIEVYDCRNAKLLGQYTRRVDTIKYMEG